VVHDLHQDPDTRPQDTSPALASPSGSAEPATADEEHHGVSVTRHREDVLRRLLDRGVSAGTLRALLPDWVPLIDGADQRTGGG